MNMLSKIKDKFSGEVYDILGKPQSEERITGGIYVTDKYWIEYTHPRPELFGRDDAYMYEMGLLGKPSSLASGHGKNKEEAYNDMLAKFGELRKQYN